MKIARGDRLVMIGDSVTDVGRARPIGEGPNDALGTGYVAFVDAILRVCHPDQPIRIANMGISGNTARDLASRWTTDVMDLNPDWLSVMIGINDVWRHFDSPDQPEIHVSIEEYEATLRDLLERTRAVVKGIVVMTPYFVEPDPADPMRVMMDRYGSVARRLAAEMGATLVDTQAAFDRALARQRPAILAADRVHPSAIGHMTLARAFLNGIDFEWA